MSNWNAKTSIVNALDIALDSGRKESINIHLTPNEGDGKWVMTWVGSTDGDPSSQNEFSEIRFGVYPPNSFEVATAQAQAAKVAANLAYTAHCAAATAILNNGDITGVIAAAAITAAEAAAASRSYACAVITIELPTEPDSEGGTWAFNLSPIVRIDNQGFTSDIIAELACLGVSLVLTPDKDNKVLTLTLNYLELTDEVVEQFSPGVNLAMNFCCVYTRGSTSKKHFSPDPRISIGHRP